MAAKLALALLLFGVTAEGAVRLIRPQPRYQIVRNTPGFDLDRSGQVPTWRFGEHGRRWRLDCMQQHPDARPLVVIGSSIFFGSDLSADQVFSAHLQRQLDLRFGDGRTCVMNFAQPGYTAQNELAEARRWLPRYPNALILWQIWDQDYGEYVVLGEHAYDLPFVELDDDGYPDTFPVPGPLDHWLFRHSRAYEYAALALAPTRGPTEGHVVFAAQVVPKLEQVRLLAEEHGSQLVLFMMPYLDQPFRESADVDARLGDRLAGYRSVAEWSDQHGLRRIDVAQLLVEHEVEAVRIDSCCHYNARGHEVLAERMLDELTPLLELPEPSGAPPAVPSDS